MGISAPTSMAAGSTATVTVTMRNTGTTTWSSAGTYPYRLGSDNPRDNLTWGVGRVTLAGTVAPRSQGVFSFVITAPSTPGTYSFSWAMLREGYAWFGATASSTISVIAPPPVYNAQLVSASVPLSMTAGSTYNVALTFKNTGNVTWIQSEYRLGSTSPVDNNTWGLQRENMSVASVAPGQSTTFSFPVRAPGTAGTYLFDWGMLWEYHLRFGQTSSINVNVAPGTTTSKPTISVSRPSLVAGQSFTTTWSTTNATSLKHVCTASGIGYTVNESLALNGSRTLTAQPGWVNYPSTCTWTASGAGGSATYTETMTTVAGSNGSVTYIHTDGLGSPVARTDAAGNVISRTRYEPYGYVASGVQPTIGFTGHVNDVETGLTYMQQRYYDPVAGRFLSIDPVVTDANTGGSFNRYVYANNNPYKYIDPDGRDCVVANGRATCTPTMGGKAVAGLPSFSVPVGSHFPSMNSGSTFHHEYIYKTDIGGKNPDSVRSSIANDPTGNHANKPASPTGTPNSATPSDGARGVAGALVNNDVKSYTFNDKSGATWTVNVTEASHTLSPGYVLRGVLGNTAVSYGEGTSFKQALGVISDKAINDVWIGQNERNVNNAK